LERSFEVNKEQARHPEAAEAATELGVENDDGPETLGTLVLAGVLVVAIVGVIALLAGYYA
jgi:hypothetical protein